ncbi:MAG TPA: hypothetical protein VMV93_03975 [Chloroflexota bacterium]|nr:hypothetical protein [Chloroflexota bacterium]
MQKAAIPIIVAAVLLLLAVYYLIPGISHPLVSANPMNAHYKHAVLFVGLAVLSLIWARFAANSARG